MASQDELKKLMQERRKQKIEQTDIPKNAKIVNGQMICLECSQVCQTMADFQRHLISQKHKSASQVLKRNAQIDVSRLENEAYRETLTKKQKLTKEQISRINKEVDQEFAEVEQITYVKEKEQQLPSDFFDQIEIETKIQQQLQEEHDTKLKQEEEDQEKDINIEEEKNTLSKLRKRLGEKQKQRLQPLAFDHGNQGIESGFELNWKSKQNM